MKYFPLSQWHLTQKFCDIETMLLKCTKSYCLSAVWVGGCIMDQYEYIELVLGSLIQSCTCFPAFNIKFSTQSSTDIIQNVCYTTITH